MCMCRRTIDFPSSRFSLSKWIVGCQKRIGVSAGLTLFLSTARMNFPSELEILLALRAEKRKQQNREAQARRRAKLNEEQKQEINAEHAEYMRRVRAEKDEEKRLKWNAYMREYRKKKKTEI